MGDTRQKMIDDSVNVVRQLERASSLGGEIRIEGDVYLWNVPITPLISHQKIRLCGEGRIKRWPGSPFQCVQIESGRNVQVMRPTGQANSIDVPFVAHGLPEVEVEGLTFDGGFAPPSTIPAVNRDLVKGAYSGRKWNAISCNVWDGSDKHAPSPVQGRYVPPLKVHFCNFKDLTTAIKLDANVSGEVADCLFTGTTGHCVSAKHFGDTLGWPKGRRCEFLFKDSTAIGCNDVFDWSSFSLNDNGTDQPNHPDVCKVRNVVAINCASSKVHGASIYLDIDGFRFLRDDWMPANGAALRVLTKAGFGGVIRNMEAHKVWRAVNLRTNNAAFHIDGLFAETFCYGTNQSGGLTVDNAHGVGVGHGWQSKQPIRHRGNEMANHDMSAWAELIVSKQEAIDQELEKWRQQGVDEQHNFVDWLPPALQVAVDDLKALHGVN